MKWSVVRVPRVRVERLETEARELMELRREERFDDAGEAAQDDLGLTILLGLTWSDVAPAERADDCQALTPVYLGLGLGVARDMMTCRSQAARLLKVSGFFLTRWVDGGCCSCSWSCVELLGLSSKIERDLCFFSGEVVGADDLKDDKTVLAGG